MLEFTDANDADAFQGAASVLSLVTALVGEAGRDGLSALDEDCVSGLWHVLDMASISLGRAAVVAQQRKEAQEAAKQAQTELAAMHHLLKMGIKGEASEYDHGYRAGLEAGRLSAQNETAQRANLGEQLAEVFRRQGNSEAPPASPPPMPNLTEPAPDKGQSQASA